MEEDSKTTVLEYATIKETKNGLRLKPTILRIENHEPPKLEEHMNNALWKTSSFGPYLIHGIVSDKKAQEWIEERKKTIIDRKPIDHKFPKYDKDGKRLPVE